jgi:inosine-uridine nucleoside N-ribohydrolase
MRSLALALALVVAITATTHEEQLSQTIIDCDPAGMIFTGLDVDDDLAILAAVSFNQSHQLNVVGLTITAGNTQLKQSYADALELRRRIGISKEKLPIYAGARWWPPPSQRPPGKLVNYTETDASRFIIDTIMKAPPNTTTVVCLGPLTNIAAALQHEPLIAGRINSLIIMGGIIKENSRLDYNFRFDRTAASAVMEAPIPKVMIPVETAIQAAFGKDDLTKVKEGCKSFSDGQNRPVICSLLVRLSMQRLLMPWLVNPRYSHILPQSRYVDEGFILWDVVALFAFVRPELFADWGRFNVMFLPERDRGNGASLQAGMNMTRIGHGNCGWLQHAPDRHLEINRVTVPLALSNESAFLELLHTHLFVRSDDDLDAIALQRSLSAVTSLGLLPYALVAVMLVLLGIFGLYFLVLKVLAQCGGANRAKVPSSSVIESNGKIRNSDQLSRSLKENTKRRVQLSMDGLPQGKKNR